MELITILSSIDFSWFQSENYDHSFGWFGDAASWVVEKAKAIVEWAADKVISVFKVIIFLLAFIFFMFLLMWFIIPYLFPLTFRLLIGFFNIFLPKDKKIPSTFFKAIKAMMGLNKKKPKQINKEEQIEDRKKYYEEWKNLQAPENANVPKGIF